MEYVAPEIVREYAGMTARFSTYWQPISLDVWEDWAHLAAKPLPAFYTDTLYHLTERHQVAVRQSGEGVLGAGYSAADFAQDCRVLLRQVDFVFDAVVPPESPEEKR